MGQYFNIVTVFGNYKFWIAFEGILPWMICITFYVSGLAFSNIAMNEPVWCIATMSAYYCMCCSKIIICNLTKVNFSIFDDFHLSVPILVATASYPLNWMFWK